MVVFRWPRVGGQFQTPIYFPLVKQESTLECVDQSSQLNEVEVRKPLVVSCYKEVKRWDSETCIIIWEFQTPAWKWSLKWISWLNSCLFTVKYGGFWKSKPRRICWIQCRLLTRQLIFCLHIHSLWCQPVVEPGTVECGSTSARYEEAVITSVVLVVLFLALPFFVFLEAWRRWTAVLEIWRAFAGGRCLTSCRGHCTTLFVYE